MRWVSLVALLVSSSLAGCLGGADDAGPADPLPATGCDLSMKPADGAECFVVGDLKVDVPLAEERTLNEAPTWRLGEWWRYRITDRFEGNVYEATRVVAGVEGDSYLVGMPKEDFSNEFMVLHVPGFGQVKRADLSFETHDCFFQFLQFPLTEDLTWDGQFECQDYTVVDVVHTSATTADLTIWGNGNANMTITYDAVVGEVTKFDIQGYALIEIIDHGYNHTGLVTVPHMHDVIFLNQRFGPTGAFPPNQNAERTDRVVVDSTYDRVSFILAVGDIASFVSPQASAVPASLGVYQVSARAPDGKVFELQNDPTRSGLQLEYFMHMFPGGEWVLEHLAAGPGITLVEGIAYHVYDVELPSGRILPNIGEHEHGQDA